MGAIFNKSGGYRKLYSFIGWSMPTRPSSPTR